MSALDIYESKKKYKGSIAADAIRDQLLGFSKDFKTSWVNLGQALYPVWKDKLYYAWGFEKFEYYTERELGLKKETATKLLKNYFFLEQDEPAYLTKEFKEERDAAQVPGPEAIGVLRMAKAKKELNREDYQELKEKVFDKGTEAGLVRRDLVAMMKVRKPVDPEEEREKRNATAIRKLFNALQLFERDMEALKLAPAGLVKEVKALKEKLEKEIPESDKKN